MTNETQSAAAVSSSERVRRLGNNIPPEVASAYKVLEWARTPQPHGGNPYTFDYVVDAEILVARFENREPETFAHKYLKNNDGY